MYVCVDVCEGTKDQKLGGSEDIGEKKLRELLYYGVTLARCISSPPSISHGVHRAVKFLFFFMTLQPGEKLARKIKNRHHSTSAVISVMLS